MHLAVYHDDPDLTPADKLRSSACVTVPDGTEVGGDITDPAHHPEGKFVVDICEPVRPL